MFVDENKYAIIDEEVLCVYDKDIDHSIYFIKGKFAFTRDGDPSNCALCRYRLMEKLLCNLKYLSTFGWVLKDEINYFQYEIISHGKTYKPMYLGYNKEIISINLTFPYDFDKRLDKILRVENDL